VPGAGALRQKPANEVTTDFRAESTGENTVGDGPIPGRSPSASACDPWREVIELGLARGRNAKAIWQDLVDDHSFTGTYQSVRRFVGKLRGSSSPEARVVISTPPGEEAQVDYGSGPMVRDPQTGKYCRTRLFVLTLGYSRKSVRFLVPLQLTHLGRIARKSISQARRRPARCRSR